MPETSTTIQVADTALSATLNIPESPTHSLLLAHGAGADHRHKHMTSLAEAFQKNNIATLRFNFPFKQAGRNRVDSKPVSTSAIIEAATFLKEHLSLPLLIGGHSFGGRMATHAVAENGLHCDAMILCSFPLHPAGKPSIDRAEHLKNITTPMLFLSGTRDKLAEQTLLTQEVEKLVNRHKIHWLDTGDHSFSILKRSRTLAMNIYDEAAQSARTFIDSIN